MTDADLAKNHLEIYLMANQKLLKSLFRLAGAGMKKQQLVRSYLIYLILYLISIQWCVPIIHWTPMPATVVDI